MSQSPFIGIVNHIEEANVSCPEDIGTTVLNLTTVNGGFARFVEKVFVSIPSFEVTITADWGGEERDFSSFATYGHNAIDGFENNLFFQPKMEVKIYDNEDPGSGSVVAETETISLITSYLVKSSLENDNTPDQTLVTLTDIEASGTSPSDPPRIVPRTIIGKSVTFKFISTVTSGPPFVFPYEIGYLWAGPTIALSTDAILAANDARTPMVLSKLVKTQGGAVATRYKTNIVDSVVEFSHMSASDVATMEDLATSVGNSKPFFFQRWPDVPAQRDRRSEGGIVRISSKPPSFRTLGANRGAVDDLYTMPPLNLTAWR